MYFLCEIQGIPCSNAPSHVFSCKYILLILLTDLHAPCTQSIMCKCSFCFGHISSWLLCKILLWHACTLAHPPVITSQSVWINLQMALGDDSVLFINFFFSFLRKLFLKTLSQPSPLRLRQLQRPMGINMHKPEGMEQSADNEVRRFGGVWSLRAATGESAHG